MTSPRIHVILARKAPYAVVFRRGPSKQVATLGWHLDDDRIDLGQWLRGRIYPYRSDLSPDGRHMIYFAMNGRWSNEVGGSWTAVSRAPWLTALHLYPWGDCWNGGGLFLDNWQYWLNGGTCRSGEPRSVSARLKRSENPPAGMEPYFGECSGIYLPRLRRDGWEPAGERSVGGVRQWDFEKPVRKGWTLCKTFHAGVWAGPNREPYYETHTLVGPADIQPLDGAGWADVRKSEILFASNGGLWRTRVHARCTDEPRLVGDLSGMEFEPRAAPYPGVPRRSGR